MLYDARQQGVGGSAVRVRAQAKLIYALGDVAYTGAYEYEAGGGSADAAEPTSAAFPWHELSFDESSFSILAPPVDASTDPFRLSFHPAGGDPWPDAGNLYVVLLQEALGADGQMVTTLGAEPNGASYRWSYHDTDSELSLSLIHI